MKIKLSVTITIKDYFPKSPHIPYKNFICLFNSNNFNSKIKLSDLSKKNSIKHKVECIDSNIIYDLHMLDSIKNSLIGIYQLSINYDQIKNLNINDILTHEERAKLLIDLKTKRKIFGKITNIGDIYLIILIEIKILDKKIYISDGRESINRPKNAHNKNNIDIIRDFNLTPREMKKLQMIKLLQIDREALKSDNYSNYNENKLIDDILDENNISIIQKDNLKRYKTLNISKMTKIINQNKIKCQNFNSSYSQIMKPKCNSTINNFKSRMEENKNKKMSRIKKAFSKKKVTVLNLMEPKMEYSLSTQTERNTLELSTLSRGFKKTFVNFKKIPMRHIKKNSFTSLYSEYPSSKGKKRKNISAKNKYKLVDGSDNSQRNNKNKILVNTSKNSLTRKTVPESKNKINNNNLELYHLKRFNTEQQRSISRKSEKINNIFLQSGKPIKKLSYIKKKPILTDNELKRLITDKEVLYKENSHNNNMNNIKRLTFSPKISIKFPENLYISNDTSSYRYIKQKQKKEVLTPRTTQIKKTSYPNITNNLLAENEELKKKCFNLIELHYLLTGKLKNVCRNNMNNLKKLEIIKEKNNNLNKNKNRLEEIKNNDESKRIKSHGFSHYKEEQLLNKMIKIKLKENSIYQNIFENYSDEEGLKDKVKLLISEKKEKLLNLIKNIVKFYGNISQIYNNDKNKKKIFKNLLDKYQIKEKNKTDLNYINYIHKSNNFEDKIITEVDEEEDEEELEKNKATNNKRENLINNINIEGIENINNASNIINLNDNNFDEIGKNYIKSNTFIKENDEELKINKLISKKEDFEKDNIYDENSSNLIKKILIEQFPENYKTNLKFFYQEKNKYKFGDKIFYAYIKDNDVILNEEIDDNNISKDSLTLNDFYKKYCLPSKKKNYVYTKKIKQKYIKIKNYDRDEQSTEKKIKNENSTTIETEIKQYSMISKTNEFNDIRNSTIDFL